MTDDPSPRCYPDLPGVLAALFSSLLDDAPWAAFLERLREAAGSTYATLILTPRAARHPGMILTPGADPGVDADYAERLFTSDPFTGLPEGRVAHFRDFVSDRTLNRNPEFRDFMGGLEVLGVDIGSDDRSELRLRLTRNAEAPTFTSADGDRLAQLVPHLRIALKLFERLAATDTEQRIYAGAVTQMAIGVIILDRDGKALQVNPRAASILAEEDGISLRGGAVVIDGTAASRALRTRLSGGSDTGPLTLHVVRPSGRGELLVVVDRQPGHGHFGAAGVPAAVLFLTDPAAGPRISADAVAQRLGLTHAEAAVAAQVADGLTLTDTAARLGIARNTVRAHLRSIFAKTGVRRQSQLVQLVHHSLPGLGQ